MDECWDLLKNGGAATVNFMEYCVRTLRKTGSGITFITQGLTEIIESPIGDAVLSNTDSKFVLKQAGDLGSVQQILKLNDQQKDMISTLHQKKGQYSEAFMSFNGEKSIIRVCPTPVEYWLASSDAQDNEALGAYRKKHPEKPFSECIYDLAKDFPFGVAAAKKS